MNHRLSLLVASLCFSLAAGCEPEASEVPSTVEGEAALVDVEARPCLAAKLARPEIRPEVDHERLLQGMGSPLWARFETPEDAAACADHCGIDPICLTLCEERLQPDAEAAPPGAMICEVCSRETGFRPLFAVRLEMLDDKTARLEWEAVAHADAYEVTVQRYRTNGEGPIGEDVWTDIKTPSFQVELQRGFRYGLMVQAVSIEGDTLQRSAVVFVDR